MPRESNPDVLVGFDTSDDAGVFLLPDGRALVQTVDFFTPIVDDPYAYGAIAAANALSDVYAMGGTPITVLNIACFDPTSAPAEVWAQVLRGAWDKCAEAGAAVVGGHSVEDAEPKFGMAVTGLLDPDRAFSNTNAQPGDRIWLSKPLGSGVLTTAMKFDHASAEEARVAVDTMSALNRDASRAAHAAGCRCATDITGFGLAGHLFNVAKASGVRVEIRAEALPLLPGVERLIGLGAITGGAMRNETWLDARLEVDESVPEWLKQVALDPQTSGGLASFARQPVEGSVEIGRVVQGEPSILLR